jgi:cell division protein FtsA
MMTARRDPLRGPSRSWPFKARDDIVTIVDLGGQKIACAIVCLAAPRFGIDAGARNIRVLGSTAIRSSGFAEGRIVNIAAAETSIRRAVAQAEGQAGLTVEYVLVTSQFAGLDTQIFEAKPASGQGVLLREDIGAISKAAEEQCLVAHRKLLHIFAIPAAENGMAEFGPASASCAQCVDVIAISMPLRGASQIAACFAKSLLTVRGYIAGPAAAALSVTNALERTAGVLVIDLGAQSTGYALFSRGVPLAAECIRGGSQWITDEIARTFRLRKFEAERLKIRYGSIYDGLQADIDLPVLNGETREPVSKFSLNRIIRANVTQALNAINERLKGAGYSIPSGGVVLTGGGSMLPGIGELASHLFAAEVRIGKPALLNGLSAGNALAALAGGCLYASRHQPAGEMAYAPGIASQDSSYASRIGQWLRASF